MMKEKNKNDSIFFSVILLFTLFIAMVFMGLSSNTVSALHKDSNGNLVSDNILDLPNVSGKFCGVNWVIKDNVVTLNGKQTCQGGNSTVMEAVFNFPIGTYSYYDFRSSNTPETLRSGLVYSNKWEFGIENGSNTTKETLVYFKLYSWDNGTIYDNVVIKPMLVKGSVVPTEYEKYNKIYYYSSENYEEKGRIPPVQLTNGSPVMWQQSYPDEKIINKLDNLSFSSNAGSLDFNSTINEYAKKLPSIKNPSYGNYGNAWLRANIDNTKTKLSITDKFKFFLNYDYKEHIGYNGYFIFFGCNLANGELGGVRLTHDQLLSNNFELSPYQYVSQYDKEKYKNAIITKIELYYSFDNEMVNLYGVSKLIDTTVGGSDSKSYVNGYDNGYLDGTISGENTGYDKGYQSGYRVGFDKGSSVVELVDGNTLTGMVKVLIESPVNLFKDITDFEFLGYNMRNFLLSILTLLLGAWVIKRMI